MSLFEKYLEQAQVTDEGWDDVKSAASITNRQFEKEVPEEKRQSLGAYSSAYKVWKEKKKSKDAMPDYEVNKK